MGFGFKKIRKSVKKATKKVAKTVKNPAKAVTNLAKETKKAGTSAVNTVKDKVGDSVNYTADKANDAGKYAQAKVNDAGRYTQSAIAKLAGVQQETTAQEPTKAPSEVAQMSADEATLGSSKKRKRRNGKSSFRVSLNKGSSGKTGLKS